MYKSNNVTFDYNKNITSFPDELIYDINSLLKLYYKNDYKKIFIPIDEDPNEFILNIHETIEYIDNFVDRFNYNLSFFEHYNSIPPIIIEQLNRCKIKIHLINNDDILELNLKDEILYFYNELDIDYVYFITIILILCNHHNVIDNIFFNVFNPYDGNKYINENFLKNCIETLNKIGYTSFNCVINNDGSYHFIIIKYNMINIPKFHTINEYF